MKIRILHDTVAGGQSVKAGDVVEASAADIRYLVAVQKAELVTEGSAPEPAPEPQEAPKRKPRIKVTPNGDLPADD
jgi:hypothetical protein